MGLVLVSEGGGWFSLWMRLHATEQLFAIVRLYTQDPEGGREFAYYSIKH